jgi:hypothetical protein
MLPTPTRGQHYSKGEGRVPSSDQLSLIPIDAPRHAQIEPCVAIAASDRIEPQSLILNAMKWIAPKWRTERAPGSHVVRVTIGRIVAHYGQAESSEGVAGHLTMDEEGDGAEPCQGYQYRPDVGAR